MTAKSKHHGNEIKFEGGKWKIPENVRCTKCDMEVPKSGVDPCLGKLPGVKNACCGHGGDGYIQFENGVIIEFNDAIVTQPLD